MDKAQTRKLLLAQRLALPDRLSRAEQLQVVLRTWLITRPDTVIGAYWPIKGEFDPLPALHRWQEAGATLGGVADGAPQSIARQIGLPVIDRDTRQLSFHAWYPGCPMEEDAYGIPKPKGTARIEPTLLLVPCVGYGPGGVRLGYGGGFYDRTLAALSPRPFTAGLAFSHGYLPALQAEPHDVPLDALLTDEGVVWQAPR
jgi:5-formyltetrahydrofolate cyclo-ligase